MHQQVHQEIAEMVFHHSLLAIYNIPITPETLTKEAKVKLLVQVWCVIFGFAARRSS